MALDFHRLDNGEYLFGINDTQCRHLTNIFDTFTQWTGLPIDQYSDARITTDNQQTLLNIIDKYIDATDLNKDKKKTSAILEFKGLIVFFLNNRIDFKTRGD